MNAKNSLLRSEICQPPTYSKPKGFYLSSNGLQNSCEVERKYWVGNNMNWTNEDWWLYAERAWTHTMVIKIAEKNKKTIQ